MPLALTDCIYVGPSIWSHKAPIDLSSCQPRSDGPSWIDLAEIRVDTTESRFEGYLNRLLQQNLPATDLRSPRALTDLA